MTPPATSTAIHKAIWAIALPSMLTNVATALFGLADMWVIGRLGEAVAQGGVEVGAKLLMTALIVFNFLRSGTVALTAQAAGRGDEAAQAAALTRGLAVALAIGVLFLLAQPIVVQIGLSMLGAAGEVAAQARTYVDIRYFGGVLWLVNAVLTGWLIGRRRMRAILAVEVGANLFHIALDMALVLGLGLGVAGVAFATLASEAAKLLVLALIVAREPPARAILTLARDRATWRASELADLFRLNRDLFARTVLLMAAMVLLTRTGAGQGASVLAANAILLQLFFLAAMILDGFESAAQVLCGEALGARERDRFAGIIRANLMWAGLGALAIACAYLAVGPGLAASFSTDPTVIAVTRTYVLWAAVLPAIGVASFVFDGVFIGASWTRAMMLSMVIALAIFIGVLLAARPLGNHGLWLAYAIFFVARAAGQAAFLPGLMRRSFAAGTASLSDAKR